MTFGKNALLTAFVVAGARLLHARHRLRVLGRGRPPTGTVSAEINRPPEEVPDRDGWPAPLADLADRAFVEMHEVPGRHTTCLHATPHRQGDDVRQAVREARQVLETGEVLRSADRALQGGRR